MCKSIQQLISVVLLMILQLQHFRGLSFSAISILVQCYYLYQSNHSSFILCSKVQYLYRFKTNSFSILGYCSSVLSVIVQQQQLQQLSALSYSTIATVVQCSQLQYNSYDSLVISVIVQQLQQFSALIYSTIAIAAQAQSCDFLFWSTPIYYITISNSLVTALSNSTPGCC